MGVRSTGLLVMVAALGCAEGIGGRDPGAGLSAAVGDSDGAMGSYDGEISASWDGGPDTPTGDGAGTTDSPGSSDGPAETTGDTGLDAAACGKVDLLLVIDGSLSMDVAQDKLSASIDSFVAAIDDALLGATDVHIGVATTTDYPYNRVGCSAPGSLISQTGGTASSAAVCGPFVGGGAWLSPGDPDVAEAFRCVAGIGLGNGNVELTAQAIISAVSGDGPGLAEDGTGCNAGFVRDDALLVVVNVTDTDDPSSYPPDQGSSGDPEGWFAAIVAAKGGVESRVVMVSILPPIDPSCTVEGNWSPLTRGRLDAPRLDALTRMFTHHYVADICAADYGAVLGEALAEISGGCDGFDPPP